MFDVLVYLFEQYYDTEFDPAQDHWARRLAAAGFESEEIDEALEWLEELRKVERDHYASLDCGFGGARVFAPEEENKLGHDCRGFLLFLENSQAVTPAQREIIIDRMMHWSSNTVSLEALKLVTLMVLWSQQAPMDTLLVEELLYAGRPLYIH